MTNNGRHAKVATTPLGLGGAMVLARQPNVVPQSRDNVGLWDGAPLGLINVQTPGMGVTPVPLPGNISDARQSRVQSRVFAE